MQASLDSHCFRLGPFVPYFAGFCKQRGAGMSDIVIRAFTRIIAAIFLPKGSLVKNMLLVCIDSVD